MDANYKFASTCSAKSVARSGSVPSCASPDVVANNKLENARLRLDAAVIPYHSRPCVSAYGRTIRNVFHDGGSVDTPYNLEHIVKTNVIGVNGVYARKSRPGGSAPR